MVARHLERVAMERKKCVQLQLKRVPVQTIVANHQRRFPQCLAYSWDRPMHHPFWYFCILSCSAQVVSSRIWLRTFWWASCTEFCSTENTFPFLTRVRIWLFSTSRSNCCCILSSILSSLNFRASELVRFSLACYFFMSFLVRLEWLHIFPSLIFFETNHFFPFSI